MKKIIYIILLFIFIVNTYASEFDFRQVNWGITKQQTMSIENSQLILDDNDVIFYKTNILNKDCILSYEFHEDKLINAMYQFKIQHKDKNQYITDFLTIRDSLIQKYGQPTNSEIIWLNNLYRNEPENLGLAISMGHVKYKTHWENNITEIMLDLYGHNFNIDIGVVYNPHWAIELMNQVAKDQLDQL